MADIRRHVVMRDHRCRSILDSTLYSFSRLTLINPILARERRCIVSRSLNPHQRAPAVLNLMLATWCSTTSCQNSTVRVVSCPGHFLRCCSHLAVISLLSSINSRKTFSQSISDSHTSAPSLAFDVRWPPVQRISI